jgi:radical SAM superfamily enzyme YgiQ (UPF0313 family)
MKMQRRVRFLEPRSRRGRPFNAWVSCLPLLGPITLATLLKERGYDAAVYNENFSGPLEENEHAYRDVCSADVIGISIMTPTAVRGYALADLIRPAALGKTIVFGGIHATFMSREALAHGDIVVRGEAEAVIEQVAGGAIRSGVIESPALEDLDALPAPDYGLMRDFDTVVSRFPSRGVYPLPIMASRGCPYGCSFCSVSRMFGRRVRHRSVEKVCQDLQTYKQQRFQEFFFYDDNFTSNRNWTTELMHRIRPLGVRFSAQARVDFPWVDRSQGILDRPLLDAMRDGGGSILYVGYETIEDSTAEQWHKGYRGDGVLRERLVEDTRILHDNGFAVHGMFVVGPEHTGETVDRIVEFARQTRIESIHLSILTPLPGTPLFEEMRPNLIFTDFPRDWDYYDGTHCVYDHGRLDVEQLQRAVLGAHRRFYRRYGWRVGQVRELLRQRGSLTDRLRRFRSMAHVARRTLKEWEVETRTFLEVVRMRRAAPAHDPRIVTPDRRGRGGVS